MTALRTLELDTRAESSVGWLRLVAAGASLFAAAWLVAISPPGRGLLCAGLGVAASLLFSGLFLRGRRTLRRAREHRLELSVESLAVVEPGRLDRFRWSEIAEIVADEERLVVEVRPIAGDPITIEPRYGGLGVHDLAATLERARLEGCAPGAASLQLRRSLTEAGADADPTEARASTP